MSHLLSSTLNMNASWVQSFSPRALSRAYAFWNDARKTRQALNRLSDHELDDLGLVRGDIDAITRD